MFWADQIGLSHVLRTIERFRNVHGPEYWTPSPLLVRLASEGRGFYA
jgi:3-hydroxyacyl-CoA dehydrogenase